MHVEFTNHPWKRKKWDHSFISEAISSNVLLMPKATGSTFELPPQIDFITWICRYNILWLPLLVPDTIALDNPLKNSIVNLCQWAYFLVLFSPQIPSSPELINQLLGWQEFQLDQNLHTFSPFLFAVYCLEQFCRDQSPFQKSYILLYTSIVNLVSIQPSFRSTKTSLLFLY